MTKVYIYLLYLSARCFTRMGKRICRVWPQGAIRLGVIGIDIYLYHNKVYQKYYNLPTPDKESKE